jgi:hypothetical protein
MQPVLTSPWTHGPMNPWTHGPFNLLLVYFIFGFYFLGLYTKVYKPLNFFGLNEGNKHSIKTKDTGYILILKILFLNYQYKKKSACENKVNN